MKSGDIAYEIVSRFFSGKTKDGKSIPYEMVGLTQMEFNSSKFCTKLKIAIEEALFNKDRIIDDLESANKFMESEAYKEAVSEGVNNKLEHELAEIRTTLLNDEQGTAIYEKYLMLCVPSPFEIKNLAKARMKERDKYREALKKISEYSPDMNGFVGPVAREALNGNTL